MSRWFTVITTAPRKQPTLKNTVDSLRSAGFNPYICAEPGSTAANASTLTHTEKKGVWHNWLFACEQALQSNREFCLVVQDDLNIHPDSKEMLEKLMDGHIKKGPISVYTPRAYSYESNKVNQPRRKPGIYAIQSNSLWGAVGFAWRRDELLRALRLPMVKTWRGAGKQPAKRDDQICNSDVAIGLMLKCLGIPAWFPVPSFGIHTSTYSSIPGHGTNSAKTNRNAEHPSIFEEPLHDQLFPRRGVL